LQKPSVSKLSVLSSYNW